jgi:transcriptional antiterminator RfaH
MLPPQAERVAALQGRWWVAHTRARNEKALAWDLVRESVGYFLPMKERIRHSGGRKRRVLMPLFTSYLFICGTPADRYRAMTTNRISHTLPVDDQDRFVRELSFLEQALQGQAKLDFYPQVAVGQTCRVTAGPFKGIEGVVVQRRRTARVVLQVGLIGRGAAMEVDADLLEPTDPLPEGETS